jgi:acyl carrier protein
MQRLKSLLSKILEIEEDQITPETSPENVETWDSFNGLLIASELESLFNVKFSMEEVASVENVRDIIEALFNHDVKLEGEI